MPEFTFPATERLKSKKQIQHIFAKGKSIKRFPLRLLFLEEPLQQETVPLKIAVAVSGKKIAKAVQRNKIKRWIREAYRTQNNNLKAFLVNNNTRLNLVFIYLPAGISDYHEVEGAMHELLKDLLDVLRG